MDVRKTDYIICYDKVGMLSAPRAYFMFKSFGAPNVYVLNGTFKKWEMEQKPIDVGDEEDAWERKRLTKPMDDDYKFYLNKNKIAYLDHIDDIVN